MRCASGLVNACIRSGKEKDALARAKQVLSTMPSECVNEVCVWEDEGRGGAPRVLSLPRPVEMPVARGAYRSSLCTFPFHAGDARALAVMGQALAKSGNFESVGLHELHWLQLPPPTPPHTPPPSTPPTPSPPKKHTHLLRGLHHAPLCNLLCTVISLPLAVFVAVELPRFRDPVGPLVHAMGLYPRQALKMLTRALSANPSNVEAFGSLVDLHAQMGQKPAAIKLLVLPLPLSPAPPTPPPTPSP
jgi:hypothetical protein